MHAYTGNVTVLEHNILQTANGKYPLMDTLFSGFFLLQFEWIFFSWKFFKWKFIFSWIIRMFAWLVRVLSWLKQESKKSWRYIRDKNIVKIHMIKTNVAHIHIRVKGWRKSSNLKMECIYSKYFLTVAQQVFFTDIQMPLNLLLQKMQKNIWANKEKHRFVIFYFFRFLRSSTIFIKYIHLLTIHNTSISKW